MMTAEQLKGSILQLAIQGKLVPQNPNDEPACLLKRRVLEETKELIAQGNVKRKKALPEISEDEIPFEIPDSWEWMRLGSIISIKAGEGLTSNEMKEGSIPVYGGNGITGFHDKALVHKETVVIGRVGFYCGSVHVTESEAWITDNAFITTYPEKSINRDYLVYVLKYMNLGKDNNATAQPVVSGKKIYPKLFPLPPLAEQKRIVAKIEEFMPFVEQYAAASTKLNTLNASFPEMMKKSILQEAVQGKLVPQDPNDEPASVLLGKIAEEKKRLVKEGKIKKQKPLSEITEDEIPFDIPESWEWVRFGNIYTMSNGIAKRTGTTGEYIGVLRLADLSEGAIDTINVRKIMLTEKEQQAYLLRCNDLIMIRVNGSKGKVGTAFVYNHIERNAYCDHLFRARSICENVCSEYIALVFNTTIIRNTFKNEIKTTAGQNTISQESMKNVLIPLPPICEQERIVNKVYEILPSVSLLRE